MSYVLMISYARELCTSAPNLSHSPSLSVKPHARPGEGTGSPPRRSRKMPLGWSPCEDDADDAIWDGLRLDLPQCWEYQ